MFCVLFCSLTMESIKLSPTTTVAMPVTLARELTANAILAAAMDVKATVRKKMKNFPASTWNPAESQEVGKYLDVTYAYK